MNGDGNLENVGQKLIEIQEDMEKLNEEVESSMKNIRKKIEEVVHILKLESAKTEAQGFKPSILLDFPDHLRKTVKALLELGIATAKQVSEKTGRSRSLESTYLNNLETMGYVHKERKGQLVYYQIKFESAKKILGD